MLFQKFMMEISQKDALLVKDLYNVKLAVGPWRSSLETSKGCLRNMSVCTEMLQYVYPVRLNLKESLLMNAPFPNQLVYAINYIFREIHGKL